MSGLFKTIRDAGRYAGIAVLALALLATTANAASKPLLIISGGGSPEHNAINHLDNVQWVESLWRGRGPIWSLVADGKNPAPDAARWLDLDPDSVEWWLQYLLMQTDGGLVFENSKSPALYAAATSGDLTNWVAGPGQTLKNGQILTLYVTDHGDRLDRQSQIVMWNERLSASDLATTLGKLPAGVDVRLVMAQCYSGGFTQTVQSLLEQGRTACGFFSTMPDKLASGCRPNPEAADYHEYTTEFFQALTGKNRLQTDASVKAAASFRQAHLSAVNNLQGIDVPTFSGEWWQALAPLPAADRAMAQAITAALPKEVPPAADAATEVALLAERLAEVQGELTTALLLRFPDVLYPFVPGGWAKIQAQKGKIAKFIKQSPLTLQWLDLVQRLNEADAAALAAEIASAKYQRRQRLERWLGGSAASRKLDAATWRRMEACETAPF